MKSSFKGIDIARIWRALDVDLSGWISLREFDEYSFTVLSAFKRWTSENHGTAMRAFRAMDRHGAGRVRLQDLTASGALASGDAASLFEGLDPNGSEIWDIRYLRFLDHWEPDLDRDSAVEVAEALRQAIEGGACQSIEQALESIRKLAAEETLPLSVKYSDSVQCGLQRLIVEGQASFGLAKAASQGCYQDLMQALQYARKMAISEQMIKKVVLGNIAVIKVECLSAFMDDAAISTDALDIAKAAINLHKEVAAGDVAKTLEAVAVLQDRYVAKAGTHEAISTGTDAGLQRLVSEGQAAAEILRNLGSAAGLQKSFK
jgi:hypothetical protein